MSPDKRRGGLPGAVFSDPARKATAIGLAVLLWFFIESRITRTIQRTLQLRFVGEQSVAGEDRERLAVVLPTDRVVGKKFYDGETAIQTVQVTITGPRFRIAALEDERLNLQITSFVGLDWDKRTGVEFTAADLPRDQRVLEGLRLELQPGRIRLEVDTIEQHSVPLTFDQVDLRGGAVLTRLKSDTAQFSPPTAIVLGQAIAVGEFQKRTGKRFRASFDSVPGAGSGRQITVPLELVDQEELGLRFAAVPMLTVEVLPQTTVFDLEVPVVVDDVALPPDQRGLYQPETRTRTVRVRAGGDLRSRIVSLRENVDSAQLADWVSENLRLHVHVLRPLPGAILGPELSLKARLMLLGPMHLTVDRNECLLDEVVVVKLRRQP
ncbi:MAG: hypothetical protein MUC36_21065 [Planctomycetes bacterium]|jgi:hypothetical protein|nr:hypothetical protein [Planctomycetota bacterium]